MEKGSEENYDEIILEKFLHDTIKILKEMVDEINLFPSKENPEFKELHHFHELSKDILNKLESDFFKQPLLPSNKEDRLKLEQVGLSGEQLDIKITAFNFFYEKRNKYMKEALELANIILGSLGTVCPPAHALKELKEFFEFFWKIKNKYWA